MDGYAENYISMQGAPLCDFICWMAWAQDVIGGNKKK